MIDIKCDYSKNSTYVKTSGSLSTIHTEIALVLQSIDRLLNELKKVEKEKNWNDKR